jgi:general stress protein CsbA
MSRKEKIDLFLNKWVSRKLTVFAVASSGLFSGYITSTDWIIVATAYIAIEGSTNIVERLMKSKNDNQGNNI